MNIEIANRLVQMRKKNNLSQEELAAKLGISRQAVSKWERAESSPDTDNLIMLARLYNVSLDDLLKTEEPVEPENHTSTGDTDADNTYTNPAENSTNPFGSSNYSGANNTYANPAENSTNPFGGSNYSSTNNTYANPAGNNATPFGGSTYSGADNTYTNPTENSANPFGGSNYSNTNNAYANPAGNSTNYTYTTGNQPPLWGNPMYANPARPPREPIDPAHAISEIAPVLSIMVLQLIFTVIPALHFLVSGMFAPLTALLYLVLGFCFRQWHPGWLIFLMIPVFYAGLYGGYPIIMTILFLLAGFLFDKWHPAWMLYITIPFFYMIAGHFH
ncbi:helix-turn-helix transcriptional regulator [Caproicibacterium amylolyticum]|uniref:helix-turn-helix transcriptional regulator n=1 Tax=Caproicibacterium amylolyticum TaxID=2766537 RepID=UPI001FEBBE55|nr:helix-turn-helix transcriptional regulator [Caproicibacterium amylolyticum]